MKQSTFENKNNSLWLKVRKIITEENLSAISSRKLHDEFPQLYRQLCSQLSIARSRNYSANLITKLEDLALRSHQLLYGSKGGNRLNIIQYITKDFPCLIRQEWRLVMLSMILLLGSMTLFTLLVLAYPQLSYMILGEGRIAEMESMYEGGLSSFGAGRDATDDIYMWGHYIKNNIGIDFTCFASGAFAGIGSILCMLFNGVFIGTVAGHLTEVGCGDTFWQFVIGHGSFELIAAGFAGAAGMKLGFSIIMPKNRSRYHAFVEDAKIAAKILYGTAAMTFIAAFIEAFWSPSTAISPTIKYVVGGSLWVILITYFIFCGRSKHAK